MLIDAIVIVLQLIPYETYRIFLTTIATILGAMLAIIFSISLIGVQHASEKYTPRILSYYVKDKLILSIYFVFSVGIILSFLFLIFEWKFSIIILFFILLVSLSLVYYNFKRVSDFINPFSLLDKLKNMALSEKNEKGVREIVLDIRLICLKSEENVAKECINKLKEICKKTESEFNRDYISAQLRVTGKKFAKEPMKQHLAVDCISALAEIGRSNIELIKKKPGTLYLISNSITRMREIFNEIVLNKELNDVETTHLDMIFNSLYLFIQEGLKDSPSELETKRRGTVKILNLMREILKDSKKIPRISEKYKWIVRSYKMNLDNLRNLILEKKLPEKIKKQLMVFIEDSERLYKKYWIKSL